MDVRTENRGRPRQEVRFPAAPVVGRNFLTPGHRGVRVRNVRGKSGPKSLGLCCFSSLTYVFQVSQGIAPYHPNPNSGQKPPKEGETERAIATTLVPASRLGLLASLAANQIANPQFWGLLIGNEKCARTFFAQAF